MSTNIKPTKSGSKLIDKTSEYFPGLALVLQGLWIFYMLGIVLLIVHIAWILAFILMPQKGKFKYLNRPIERFLFVLIGGSIIHLLICFFYHDMNGMLSWFWISFIGGFFGFS